MISHEDLVGMEAQWRDPVEVSYRGHSIISMPPTSSGGATLAAIIFGFVITFVTTLVDGVSAVMVSVTVMALVLAIRPQGLMGRVIA